MSAVPGGVSNKGIGALAIAPDRYVPERVRAGGFASLPVLHALAVAGLSLSSTDPFDQLFIAQAQCEGMTVGEPGRDH